MFFLESGRLLSSLEVLRGGQRRNNLKYNAVLADPDSAESLDPDSMNLKPKH
jgi:hypothetical protein